MNMVVLGIAFQKGYLPLSAEMLEQAILGRVDRDSGMNLRAFRLGRQLAARPARFTGRFRTRRHSPSRLLRQYVRRLRQQHRGRRGRKLGRRFEISVQRTWRAAPGQPIDAGLMRDIVVRAYDCLTWGGLAYARRYLQHVRWVLAKDRASFDYQMTRAVVWNLAQAMLIKDEVHVASLLTSAEKYHEDRKRFNISPAHGDKVRYRHYHRPELAMFGQRFGFDWRSRHWQLRLLSRMRWLRSVMPSWHDREVAMRDWYEGLVRRVRVDDTREYRRWLAVLSCMESVTGFRDVRYPKMEAARRRVDQLLSMDPDAFDSPVVQPPAEAAVAHDEEDRTVPLLVVPGPAEPAGR